MTIATRNDGLKYWKDVPRLPYTLRSGDLDKDQFSEILYWTGEFGRDGADPILLECQINYVASQYQSDRSHWHDKALERAEQLNETYTEIRKFGRPVVTDRRIAGNPQYKQVLQVKKQLDRQIETDTKRFEDLKSIKWLVDFNSRHKNKNFDNEMIKLFDSAGTPAFKEQYRFLLKVYNTYQRDSNVGRREASLDRAIHGVNPMSGGLPQRFNCKDVTDKRFYCND